MILVSTIHTKRIFNFDSEINEISLDNNLKIIKAEVSEEDKSVMSGDINFNMWPNFVIQKTYDLKYKTPEYAIINTDYIINTLKDFTRALTALRLIRNSAIFFDHQTVSETLVDGKQKLNPSIITNLGYTRFTGEALIIKKNEITELVITYKNIKNCREDKFFIALSRLNFGMEKILLRDKLIDYITGLEALYTESSGELRFRLSIFIATIFGNTLEEKEDIYNFIKNIYDARCEIIHGNKKKKSLREEDLNRIENYLRVSLKSYLENSENFKLKNLLKLVFKQKYF